MASIVSQAAQGFQFPYSLHISKKAEDAVLQGGNHTLAIPSQLSQLAVLFSQYNILLSLMGNSFSKLALRGGGGILFGGACVHTVLAAGYVDGKYSIIKRGYDFVAERLCLPNFLSGEIGGMRSEIYRKMSDNLGKCVQVAAVIAILADAILGFYLRAVAALTTFAIGVLDQNAYLPSRVSVFVNGYLPIVGYFASVFLGSPLQKAVALTNIAGFSLSLFSKARHFVQDFLDERVREAFHREGVDYPSLREMRELRSPREDPNRPAKLTVDQIRNFDDTAPLLVDFEHIVITPRVCFCRESEGFQPLRFNDLFAFIDWSREEKFRILERKILNDNRWREYVHASEERRQFVENRSAHFQEWKSYAIDWAKEQMNLFAQNMTGRRLPKGNLKGFESIKNTAASLMRFLVRMRESIDEEGESFSEEERRKRVVFYEDILLRLAIEGGDYCVQGLERVVRESIDQCMFGGAVGGNFKERILMLLEMKRERSFDFLYYNLSKIPYVGGFFDFMDGNDVHAYNYFKKNLTPGLSPFSDEALMDVSGESGWGMTFFSPILPHLRIGYWSGAYFSSYSHIQRLQEGIYSMRRNALEQISQEGGRLGAVKRLAARVRKLFFDCWKNILLGGMDVRLMSFEADVLERNYAREIQGNPVYRQSVILNAIKESFGHIFSMQDYIGFWEDYVRRIPHMKEKEKQDFLWETLENISDYDFMKRKHILSDKYLKIMAIEMGILKNPLRL